MGPLAVSSLSFLFSISSSAIIFLRTAGSLTFLSFYKNAAACCDCDLSDVRLDDEFYL